MAIDDEIDSVTASVFSYDILDGLTGKLRKEVKEILDTAPSRRKVLGKLADIADELYWALHKMGDTGNTSHDILYESIPQELKDKVSYSAFSHALTARGNGLYKASIVGALSSQNNNSTYLESITRAHKMYARIREPKASLYAASHSAAMTAA